MAKKITKIDVKKIYEIAKKRGIESNFFFVSTMERYETQLSILGELKVKIKEIGMTVSKEYVKGRENVCINPVITEYNKTATAANGTVSTLISIIEKLTTEDGKKPNKLAAFMSENE